MGGREVTQILIGPMTRQNVPVAIEVKVEQKVVTEAKVMARNMRGFEYMLRGREPMDAPYFTQRVCGICSTAHAYASCLALEDATGMTVTRNAVLIRNILFGGDVFQNHIRHFYLLALPDFVDLPEKPPWAPRTFFVNPLPQAVNQRMVRNYFQAFEVSRDAHTLAAIMGGRAPHSWSLQPGGATIQPTAERVMRASAIASRIRNFITEDYRQDVEDLARYYPEYFEYGARPHNYIAYGALPDPDKPHDYLFPPGVALDGERGPLEVKYIREDIEKSWYQEQDEGKEADQFFTPPPEPDREKAGAYSWIKAVRYRGKACEGGPLARAYLSGEYSKSNGTLDRHLARRWEAALYVELVKKWINQLQEEEPSYLAWKTPQAAKGQGLIEAMRGPLGHWVEIAGGQIKNYTIITPSVWNMGPRRNDEDLGVLEESLIGTPIADPANPVEIGRVVRAFDPCTACAVHVITATRRLEPIEII